MEQNILCHIVGLNNSIKENITRRLNKYKKLIIIDLDDISSKILNNNVMTQLFTKYNVYYDNGMLSDAKHIDKKMGKLWQIIIIREIGKILKNNLKKKIIFIGSSIFQNNNNYRFNIGKSVPKFFYKTDIQKNAKEIVRFNLDKYKKNIIDGTFPIKLINLNYLIKKKKEIMDYYIVQKKYKYITLKYIIDYVEKNMDQYERILNIPKLFVGSLNKYDNVISLDKIIAYSYDWLAIVSIIPDINRKIKKGFMNNKPFIEEKCKNAMNCFNTNGYLYQVDKSNFKFCHRGGGFKLIADKPVAIIKRTYISNMYKKLLNKKIKLSFS